ncbi:MAG: glycosyltransferase family 2 protein [Wenzhouxiangellaceae bacterium]
MSGTASTEQVPTVAIVVLNWGVTDCLKACLEAVLAQRTRARLHVLVVDNESSAESREQILGLLDTALPERHVLAWLGLLAVDENRGFAAGMNAGIQMLEGRFRPDWFWLLNNDAEPAPQALARLLEVAAENRRAGMIGSRIEGEALGRGHPVYGGFHYNPATTRIKPCLHPDDRPDYLAGAAMLLRAEMLRQVGYLSEDYFLYCEELELARRAQAHGWQLAHAPESRVRHASGSSIAARSPLPGRTPDWAREYFENRSALRFTMQYHARWLPLVLVIRCLVKLARGLSGRARFGAFLAAARDFRHAGKWMHENTAPPQLVWSKRLD